MNGPRRTPLFWILIALSGVTALCCVGTMGVVALGAITADEMAAPSPPSSAGGGEWIPSLRFARGTGMTQELVGGRWLSQSGSGLETVVARFTQSALVAVSSTGELNELRFDDDGTYSWNWVNSSNFQGTHRSAATERGTWVLEGSTLTLTADSQKALYTANTQSQEKEDLDLAPRSYQLIDLTLETAPNTGAPLKQFPGIEFTGPCAPWDLQKGTRSLDLQRL